MEEVVEQLCLEVAILVIVTATVTSVQTLMMRTQMIVLGQTNVGV